MSPADCRSAPPTAGGRAVGLPVCASRLPVCVVRLPVCVVRLP